MTKLYVNAALDWLLTDGVDNFLLVDAEGGRTPPDYPLTPAPRDCTISSYSPNYVSISNNLTRYSYSRGSHAWGIELRYGAMSRAAFAPLWAFLISQGGQAKTFTVGLPAFTPLGSGSGTPQVNGGLQSGGILQTDGWAFSQTVLKKGDWIQIETDKKVYMVTEDVVSNGAGLANVSIYPSLRRPASDNLAIFVDPLFTCALTADLLDISFDQCLKPEGLTIQLQEIQ